MPKALQAGDRVSEYILDERIGQGTFGEVWRAHHHVFRETVAIKVPTDREYIKNLQSEGIIQHDVVNEHIVRSRGLDPWHDPPYLVMEYVEGETLRQAIQARGALGLGPAVEYTRQVLEALQAAHAAGIIHRDLKPENVLIGRDGVLKVMDFGLGRVLEVTTASIMLSGSLQSVEGKSISGTLEYMSPEQRVGGEVDARSDLYAVGVMFFEMLTGERPGGSEVPSEVARGVPPGVDDFYRRCYARREKRFASAAEALLALEAAMKPPAEGTVAVPPLVEEAPLRLGPVTCASCKSPAEPDDFFCIRCGAQLRGDLKRCPQCGGFPQEGDQHCVFCGRALAARSG